MKLWMRLTAFVIAAQFLNVQLNIAMGNRAMAEMMPEYRAAMQQLESRVGGIFDGMTEAAELKLAYRMYRVGVKARNRVLKMSEEQFQSRLKRVTRTPGRSEDAPPTMEETELAQEVNGIDELGELKNGYDQADQIDETPIMTSKADFMAKVDPVLTALGSVTKANGKMTIAKKSVFTKNILELSKKQDQSEMRSPSSSRLSKTLTQILIVAGSILALALVASFVFVIFSTLVGALFIALVVTGLALLTVDVVIRI